MHACQHTRTRSLQTPRAETLTARGFRQFFLQLLYLRCVLFFELFLDALLGDFDPYLQIFIKDILAASGISAQAEQLQNDRSCGTNAASTPSPNGVSESWTLVQKNLSTHCKLPEDTQAVRRS